MQSTGTFRGGKCDTAMVGTRHYLFVKTHKMSNPGKVGGDELKLEMPACHLGVCVEC